MKFNEFIGQPKDEAPKGMEIDGSFGCQVCYEQVEEAEYFQVERILKWKCSQGHVSFIEDFVL